MKREKQMSGIFTGKEERKMYYSPMILWRKCKRSTDKLLELIRKFSTTETKVDVPFAFLYIYKSRKCNLNIIKRKYLGINLMNYVQLLFGEIIKCYW